MSKLPSLRAPAIIGAWLLAGLLLAGCSALRLAYDQGPQLAYWWLDGYADFDAEQRPRVRAAIDDWFGWHRRTQLPEYVALLERARADVGGEVAPEEICRLGEAVRDSAARAVEPALPALAQLASSLSDAQLRHIERRFDKRDAEFRDDYLQEDPRERRRVALERTVERVEMLYGRLERPQRERLARGIAASPFDAERWLAERRMRQADIVATLRRVRDEHMEPASAQAALRDLARRMVVSTHEDYRRYERTLTLYNCALAADVQRLSTPAQRQKARERIDGYIGDLRALIASRPPLRSAPQERSP